MPRFREWVGSATQRRGPPGSARTHRTTTSCVRRKCSSSPSRSRSCPFLSCGDRCTSPSARWWGSCRSSTSRLGRLVGDLRENQAFPTTPPHAAARHHADDDPRTDARRRVPSLGRCGVVGHPGPARRPGLPRGAAGRPLVSRVPRALRAHGRGGRAVPPRRGHPRVVHQHDVGLERDRHRVDRLRAPRVIREPAQPRARRAAIRAGEIGDTSVEYPAELDRRATEGRHADDRRPLRCRHHPVCRRRRLHSPRATLAPAEVVGILDELFSRFDALVERHGLEKIKTIGDCYMAAAGVPDPGPDHARKTALLALDMREEVATFAMPSGVGVELRIGINSGRSSRE